MEVTGAVHLTGTGLYLHLGDYGIRQILGMFAILLAQGNLAT